MKRCTKCGKSKPLDEFYRATGMRDGYRSDCKACNLRAKHDRYIANPGPTIERVKKWVADNRERRRCYEEEYKQSGRKGESDRRSHLKRKFGLSQEDYDRLLVEQGGGCAICGRLPRTRSLHVDH